VGLVVLLVVVGVAPPSPSPASAPAPAALLLALSPCVVPPPSRVVDETGLLVVVTVGELKLLPLGPEPTGDVVPPWAVSAGSGIGAS
jgi:hypothetical protein